MFQRCSGTGQAIHAISFGSKHYIQIDTVMSAGTSDCAAKQDLQTGSLLRCLYCFYGRQLRKQHAIVSNSFIQQNLSSLGL